MRRCVGTVLMALALCAASASVAEAGRRRARDTAPVPAAIPQTRMYYPQEIEGGSAGNLPFNNQIRKHVDPLNANGGR